MRKSTSVILAVSALAVGFVLGRGKTPPSPVEGPPAPVFDWDRIGTVRISRPNGTDPLLPVVPGEYRIVTVFLDGKSTTRPVVQTDKNVCIEFGGGNGLTVTPVE